MSNFFLEAKVEKFEDKLAVLKTADNQLLKWPIKNLPEEIEIGSQVRISLSTALSVEAERAEVAKTILNQILKTDSGNEVGQKKKE